MVKSSHVRICFSAKALAQKDEISKYFPLDLSRAFLTSSWAAPSCIGLGFGVWGLVFEISQDWKVPKP